MMRLEDSLLYLIIDAVPSMGLEPFCEAAVAGGVDIIHLGPRLLAEAAAAGAVCHRMDALLVVSGDASDARAAGADGVHIGDATASVGQYRAGLGEKGLVGVSTRHRHEAMLALEMGVDFLLHWAGTRCAAEFSSLPGAAGNALFAAGLETLDDARVVVDTGVYRLCIHAVLLEGGDVTGKAAAFSGILGRCI